jgi:YD repeat-containing protein
MGLRLDTGTVLAQTWDCNHRVTSQTLTAHQCRFQAAVAVGAAASQQRPSAGTNWSRVDNPYQPRGGRQGGSNDRYLHQLPW